MIRLLSRIFIAAICVSGVGMAQAVAQTAAPQAGKIVWVNAEQAVYSCDEGKNEYTEIQKFVDEKNTEMSNMRKEYESLNNQLSVQGSKLTDEARADLQYQISIKETALQRFQQDTQADITNKRNRADAYILKRLQPVIEKIARERGYAAVLNLDAQSLRDIWIDETLIITDDVVKAYNATYPVSKPKPPTPPAAE
jgi:Skp family chaperone for outer membrane proteins